MGRITVDQSHQIMAALAVNTNWEEIDFDALGLQDTVIRNPKNAGAAFTAWLKSGANSEAVAKAPLPPKKAKKSVLNFHEEVLVPPLLKRFVPNEFFTTRKGLYLWNDMQRVLRDAQIVEPTQGAVKFRSFNLAKNAYDREIKTELPGNHEVELWQIAELIEAQKSGEDGPLLTNGYANIFYVAGYAVSVRWNAVDREWHVGGWALGVGRWGAGGRVFSRN